MTKPLELEDYARAMLPPIDVLQHLSDRLSPSTSHDLYRWDPIALRAVLESIRQDTGPKSLTWIGYRDTWLRGVKRLRVADTALSVDIYLHLLCAKTLVCLTQAWAAEGGRRIELTSAYATLAFDPREQAASVRKQFLKFTALHMEAEEKYTNFAFSSGVCFASSYTSDNDILVKTLAIACAKAGQKLRPLAMVRDKDELRVGWKRMPDEATMAAFDRAWAEHHVNSAPVFHCDSRSSSTGGVVLDQSNADTGHTADAS